MIKKLEVGMQVYETGEIKGFENCGVDIKEVDYSLRGRHEITISTTTY